MIKAEHLNKLHCILMQYYNKDYGRVFILCRQYLAAKIYLLMLQTVLQMSLIISASSRDE